ncbi:MAG: hypothetical protein AB7G47_10150 [Mycolicibacterium sp.]|uniref:hypothetical protein n=1 Tax=Mycolicibacterium sp. TaxID=2320850 RepID=UPI003D133A04
MSEVVMSESGNNGADPAELVRPAVDEHRRQLEAMAAEWVRVGELDRQIERLQSQRAETVRLVEQLHTELTSGRAAGAAIAALGLPGLRRVGKSAKPARRPAKRSSGRANNRKPNRQGVPAGTAGCDTDADTLAAGATPPPEQ